MLCSRNISVHLSEIQRSCACDFTEHGDKVAGVGKSGSAGNILDLHIRSGKQKLTGAADAVHGNVFVNRAAHKTAEQTGKILRRDKNAPAQLRCSDILPITGFDFLLLPGSHISGREDYPVSSEKLHSL